MKLTVIYFNSISTPGKANKIRVLRKLVNILMRPPQPASLKGHNHVGYNGHYLLILGSLSNTSLSFNPNLHSGVPDKYALIIICPETSDLSTLPKNCA